MRNQGKTVKSEFLEKFCELIELAKKEMSSSEKAMAILSEAEKRCQKAKSFPDANIFSWTTVFMLRSVAGSFLNSALENQKKTGEPIPG